MPIKHSWPAAAALALPIAIGGCAVGPDYQRPGLAQTPAAYKEAQTEAQTAGANWKPAAPADAIERGKWWTLFNDPTLDALAARVAVSNQNVAAAAAAYDQARALVGQQRAAMFPSVSLSGGANRSGSFNNGAGTVSTTTTTTGTTGTTATTATTGTTAGGRTNLQLSIGASWEPDVWGRLRRTVDSASAGAQASAGDLASATLSAQGELATDYFSLRQTDAQRQLLEATVAAYQRALQIAQNRYAAGIATKTDVLQAQTQLSNAQADLAGLERQRAQFEHAIAVLVGDMPSSFSLPAAPWNTTVPDVPPGIPSALLQRRPDIAAAERRVAAANEQIGIAQSAYYPNLGLSASIGSTTSRVADLFSASTSVWALGLQTAQILFDAGAIGERVAGARAAHAQAVARYRQTVLAAFQNVEDQLAAVRVLAQQETLRRDASRAADEAEALQLNRYRAGQISYTDVVSAQTTALNARRALVQAQADRQTAAIALIQALGGGWQAGR